MPSPSQAAQQAHVAEPIEPMFVVEEASKFAADLSSGIVTVEARRRDNFSLAISELQGVDARHLAIGYAARRGVSDPRQNGNVQGPYAVNSQGIPLENVSDNGRPLPPSHPLMQPAAYRVDVPVCRKLV